jgi:hypothetical protein
MESPLKYFASMEDYRKSGYVKHKMADIIAMSTAAISKKQAQHAAQNFSLLNKLTLHMIKSHEPGASSGSKIISAKKKTKNGCLG